MCLGLYSFLLPNTPARGTGPVDVKALLGLNALGLLKDRSFATFALCSFLFCMPLAFYYQFATWLSDPGRIARCHRLDDAGTGIRNFRHAGLALLLKRYGIKKVLMLGFVTAAIRYLFFIYGGTADVWAYSMLFLGILLHGVSYDFYFVTGYIYVDKKAPAHMRTAAQGLITLICQGLGSFIGNWLGGQAMTTFALQQPRDGMTFDWFAVWGVGAAMVVAVMLLFLLFFRERNHSITPINVTQP
nr:MFS transporter [Serratia odorifera]